MEFELAPKRSLWTILLTPGPIIMILGLIVLAVSFYYFNSASPGGDVDAIIEAQSRGSERIKSMLGMVVGVVLSIGGVLFSLLTFSKRSG